MKKLILVLSFCSNIFGSTVFIDQFHLMQNQYVIKYEHKIDVLESVLLGLNIFEQNLKSVDYDFSVFDFTYRRYVFNQDSGPFYSFGFRYGTVKMNTSTTNEVDNLYMPYYDVGLKTKLSNRWYHTLKLEAGYVMLYTQDIDVNTILGLQFIPYFSFGYKLD